MFERAKLIGRRIVYQSDRGIPIICGVAPKRMTHLHQQRVFLDPKEESIYNLYEIGRLRAESFSRYDGPENLVPRDVALEYGERMKAVRESFSDKGS